MDLNETRKYLERTNGDVNAAIEIINGLDDYKREITYEMQSAVRSATGMELNSTRRYLEVTNGNVEAAIRLIKGVPEEPKNTSESDLVEAIVKKTGVSIDYAKKVLNKFDNDIEKAISHIELKRKKKMEKDS